MLAGLLVLLHLVGHENQGRKAVNGGPARGLGCLQAKLLGDGLGGLVERSARGRHQDEQGLASRVGHLELLGRVLMLPASGHGEADFQLGVVKHAVFDEALLGVFAIHHAVDEAQVLVAVHGELGVAVGLFPLLGQLLHGVVPVFGVGVGGEEIGNGFFAALSLLTGQGLEKIGHLAGIVANFGRVLHAQLIGLPLVVAAEFQKQQLHALHGLVAKLRHLGREYHGAHQPHLAQNGLGLLPGRVPGRNVPDFVAQDPGKLGFVVEMSHNTPREIHVAAGHGKRVNHRRIDDLELILQAAAVRDGGHLLPFLVDEFLHLRVGIQTELGRHGWVRLRAHGHFLAFGYQDDFFFASDGVHGAAAKKQNRCRANRQSKTCFHKKEAPRTGKRAGIGPPVAGMGCALTNATRRSGLLPDAIGGC